MAKMQKMKMMKKNTRMRPGIDDRSDWICRRMVGILLTERSGLKIRNVLRALRLSLPPLIGSKLTMLMVTMKKSRQFQASRR